MPTISEFMTAALARHRWQGAVTGGREHLSRDHRDRPAGTRMPGICWASPSARGNAREGAGCIRRALKSSPTGRGTIQPGQRLREQRRLPEAAACYQRILDLNPDLAPVVYSLGNVQRDLGNLDRAAACYRRAVELNPDHVEAYICNLSNVLADAGGGMRLRPACGPSCN